MNHIDKLIAITEIYKGQEEVPPNLGFKDPIFDAKMKGVGFYRSASWCAFFVRLVLKEAYNDVAEIQTYLLKYASPSTHEMWANFSASKEVITGQIPKPGAVIVWQEGSGTNGHTGIVTSIDGNTFKSVEGNTNGEGGREGFRVWENTHTVGLPHKDKGLNILGFAYMPV